MQVELRRGRVGCGGRLTPQLHVGVLGLWGGANHTIDPRSGHYRRGRKLGPDLLWPGLAVGRGAAVAGRVRALDAGYLRVQRKHYVIRW